MPAKGNEDSGRAHVLRKIDIRMTVHREEARFATWTTVYREEARGGVDELKKIIPGRPYIEKRQAEAKFATWTTV